ncbi:hypothetical protein [Leptospira interrogans]|uniref:hypothetical protein n=1 Tax=Leptospira interrogans TaxID=173 RepID=UPI00027858E6|nr:hypothetical protein LEP1GSC080_0042 [Leptospira interrogans str. FPW2026]
MKKIKIVTVITLFLISLTGCKKSQEELAKEEEKKKLEVVNSSSAEPTPNVESGVRKSVVQLEKVK